MGLYTTHKRRQKIIGVNLETDEHTLLMTVTEARKQFKIKHYDLKSSLLSDYYPAKGHKWFYEDDFAKFVENGTFDKIVAKAKEFYDKQNYKKKIVCIDVHGCKFEYPNINAASDDTLVPYKDIYNECMREKKKGIFGYKFYFKHVYDNAAEQMQKAKQAYLELM